MELAEHIQIVELHKSDFEANDPRALAAATLLLTEVHLGVALSLEQLQGPVSAMTNHDIYYVAIRQQAEVVGAANHTAYCPADHIRKRYSRFRKRAQAWLRQSAYGGYRAVSDCSSKHVY